MLLKPFWPEARFWNFCGILRPIFVSSSSFFKLYFLGVCVFFLPFFFSSGGSLDGDLTTSHTWVIILLERARAVPKIQRSNSLLCFIEGCRSLLSLTTTSTFCFCFLIIIFKLECQIFEIGSCWIFSLSVLNVIEEELQPTSSEETATVLYRVVNKLWFCAWWEYWISPRAARRMLLLVLTSEGGTEYTPQVRLLRGCRFVVRKDPSCWNL